MNHEGPKAARAEFQSSVRDAIELFEDGHSTKALSVGQSRIGIMAAGSEFSDVVAVSADIMSGTPVFRGTRVPVHTLMDHLDARNSLDEFLADFPTVRREQVLQFLEPPGRTRSLR